jgi:DNA invertase Pin-like site-specific DNA recombinase
VIAEYEKAKIAERYRRGKLFRARAGEIVTWKVSYGYRRIPRSAGTGQAHHEVYKPEAAVVRRIFTDRAAATTVREICRRLNADAIPSPTGKPTWGPLHTQPAPAQRGLHRPGLLQPHRIGARPAPQPPQPTGPARPRRMDPDRLPPDHLR